MNGESDIHINLTRHAGGPVMDQSGHLAVLDGWRGVSILFVLAAHLLPLGPRALQLNSSVGILGMALFFNLSGFLITSFLLQDQRIGAFLIKRFCRVLPLAWLYLAVALSLSAAPLSTWLSQFLFYANLPPQHLTPMTEHMWSLSMEVQFYVGVALLVVVLRARGLLLLPILGVMFTLLRASQGIMASSVSYYRIDEILAGCTLALAFHGPFSARFRELLAQVPQWWLFLLLALSSMPQGGWLNYLRPYLAAVLIGATIVRPGTGLVRLLGSRFLLFCAAISYALYVIHPILSFSWLASGTVVEKYAKRPLFLAVLFVLAYVSTRYYESWFIALGRKWARRVGRQLVGPLANDAAPSTLQTTDPLSPK